MKSWTSSPPYAQHKGYPAAPAYIPAQTAEWGRLRVAIAPGRFGRIALENDSRLKSRVAEGYFAGLKSGDIIKNREVEAAMRKLQNITGVEVGGVLSPGSKPGERDLLIKVMNGKANSLIVYAENYGSKSAGRYRYGLQGELGNLGGTGAKVDLGLLISNKHQHGYNLSVEMPVGHSGTTVGLGFSRSDYELGSLAQALGAEGVANTYSIYGRTPIFDTGNGSMEVKYGYDYRDITDELTAYDWSWKKHSHIFHLGVDGTGRLPTTWLHYDLTLHAGTLVPDSQEAKELAALGDTEGRFTKGTLDLTAVQRLGHATDILCKFSAQKAPGQLRAHLPGRRPRRQSLPPGRSLRGRGPYGHHGTEVAHPCEGPHFVYLLRRRPRGNSPLRRRRQHDPQRLGRRPSLHQTGQLVRPPGLRKAHRL